MTQVAQSVQWAQSPHVVDLPSHGIAVHTPSGSAVATCNVGDAVQEDVQRGYREVSTLRPRSGGGDLLKQTFHRPTESKRPLDPLWVPECVGLVQPTLMPYILEDCGNERSQGSVDSATHQSSKQSLSSIWSTRSAQCTPRKPKQLPNWSDRHHVCESKDNRQLPRLQRMFFDDQPQSSCRGGVYQKTLGHRSRNFDVFCSAPTNQQHRDLNQRFERYPFLEALRSDASLAEVHVHQQWPAPSPRQPQKKKKSRQANGIRLMWKKHLRADRGDLQYRPQRGADAEASSDDGDDELMSAPSAGSGMHQHSVFSRGGLPHFHVFCVSKFGSYVRLWRCLDKHNNMCVGERQFLKELKELGYHGDARQLFKVLNRDQSGTLNFYHFAPEAALAVAQLLHWARVNHGGLKGLGLMSTIDQNQAIRKGQFTTLFKKKGFYDDLAIAYAFELIDKDGDGSVNRHEANSLDKWDYPEWLVVEPDAVAAEYYKSRLFDKAQGNTLLAWRYLDRTCSMRVSWQGFRAACRKILNGEDCSKLAVAWRFLDSDLSGWLSLREFDSFAYDALSQLHTWVQSTYGGITAAFPKLSGAGVENVITHAEFRHVCKKSEVKDDVINMIFRGLDVDGTGTIARQEVAFLDNWKVCEEGREETAWASVITRGAPKADVLTESSDAAVMDVTA